MEDKVLIIKYGEISLRGKNRKILEDRIILAIRKNVDPFGKFYVRREQGRLILERLDGEFDFDTIIPKVTSVFGLLGVCPGIRTDKKELSMLKELALAEIKRASGGKNASFKVETKRADKKFPGTSSQISADIGAHILENIPNLKVDLHKPDIVVNIEIRTSCYVSLSSDNVKAWGGLPYGSSGTAVALMSGGIDSPVAAWLMARRGVRIEAVYFHSPPYTSERALDKVCDLAKRVSEFTGGLRLYSVPFTETQLYLLNNVPHDKLTVHLKRAMMRAAEIIAEKIRAQGLVTGDSVGQVASQTMKAIECINAAASLPVYRPLAGYDKQEIIDLAEKIGTFEISSRPYEDCCTIFVAKHPELSPKLSVIEAIEKNNLPELSAMIEKSVEEAQIFDF
ncbi:MAG: tRNA 4-thiouridine(8) synthase ThiI [Firmicutes bacterium]|nr:tRNA 4-thiouridine(8) synthase ThiI [Bacillota bacterium]